MTDSIFACARLGAKLFSKNIARFFNVRNFTTLQTNIVAKVFNVPFPMFSIVFTKMKIARSIIIGNVVFMMNILGRLKIAPNLFLHNKAMFHNIPSIIRKRMTWFKDKNISFGVFISSTLPFRIFRTQCILSCKMLRTTFKRAILSLAKIFLAMRRAFHKSSATGNTFLFHSKSISQYGRFVKHRFVIILFILCSLYINAYALDWDIVNEDFANLASWDNNSSGNCTATAVTEDEKSCLKLYVPAGEAASTAQIGQTLTDPGDTFTLEISFKQTHFSTGSDHTFHPYGLGFAFTLDQDPDHEYRFEIGYDNTNYFLKIRRTNIQADIRLAMLPISTSTWHTIRLVVEASRLTSVWLDDYCYEIEETYTRTIADFVNYRFNIFMFGWGVGSTDQIVYVDYARIDTTPEHPTTDSPIKIGTESIIARYRQDGGNDGWSGETQYDYVSAEKVRYSKDGSNVFSIPIAATSHNLASKARIYDGSTVKSLMKLPE